jgi:hypothetical protein
MTKSILAPLVLFALVGGCGSPSSTETVDHPTDTAQIPANVVLRTPDNNRLAPPPAVVDGVTYSGEQQVDAMTQAARDAGMDEAAAKRTGEEAAMLCNGNSDCLR